MTTNFSIGSLDIPPMALGTMYFGTRVSPRAATACLDVAYEVGARFWDTANNYAFWAGGVGDESEAVLGAWLAARGPAARDEVTVATKIGARPAAPGAGLEHTLGLSAAAVRAQVVDSLRRLRTDRVDVLYAHVDDRTVPLAETLHALGELVDEGLVCEIAASNLTAARVDEAVAVAAPRSYAAVQQRFTYLVPAPDADLSPHVLLDEAVEEACVRAGLTRLGYSPLLSGAYVRDDRPTPQAYDTAPGLAELRECADGYGLDAGQTVLAWMVHRRLPVVPVVGVSREEQVRQAWAAVTTDITRDDASRLDTARHG